MKRMACLVVVAIAIGLPRAGAARTDRELTYRENEIWNGAIRFLRVDSGFRILEKDRESGYVLFEYKDEGAPCTASFEMVRTTRDGRSFVRARIQIPQMPRYVEAVLMDRLVRKLRDEFGEPPPAGIVAPAEKPKPGDRPAAEGAKKGAAGGGKSSADGEQDPEAGDEAELEPTEEGLEGAAEEG